MIASQFTTNLIFIFECGKLSKSPLLSFVDTIARLRAPDGCPWDREQTHETLAKYLLEESYEVLEAIHEQDPSKLQEELGDLLLQIVLNAQVAKDMGTFDIDDVARGIDEKMIRRHPHVFARDEQNKDSDSKAVVARWEEIKKKEKEHLQKDGESVLDGVPRHMPALMQALKISQKAVREGFEWAQEKDVWEKLYSEMRETQAAIEKMSASNTPGNKQEIALEIGDMLFCIVNIARWHDLEPEECLIKTMEKFKRRFKHMEDHKPKPLRELSLEEWDVLWESAKKNQSKT